LLRTVQLILNSRRRFHRTLLIQSISFYSIWSILWSSFVLTFQFISVNTTPGIATSLFNYVQVAIDPAIVAVIDVRFIKAWKATWRKMRNHRQRQIVPTLIARKY
jgi:hypothetical protein